MTIREEETGFQHYPKMAAREQAYKMVTHLIEHSYQLVLVEAQIPCHPQVAEATKQATAKYVEQLGFKSDGWLPGNPQHPFIEVRCQRQRGNAFLQFYCKSLNKQSELSGFQFEDIDMIYIYIYSIIYLILFRRESGIYGITKPM